MCKSIHPTLLILRLNPLRLRDSDGEPIKSNAGAENAADDVAVAQFRDEVGSTEEDDIEVAGENGAKIQLTDRMVKVAKLICDCAEVCEAYYKQKLVGKSQLFALSTSY